MAGDARAKVFDGGVELRFGNETVDDAEIESALGGNRFAEEDEFERYFWADEERENRGRERRKNTERDFWLGEAGFRRGNHHVAERSEFRASANGRTVDNTDDGLRGFKDACENGVERVQHLKDTIGGVFADVDAAAKNLAGGIEKDEFHIVAVADVSDAVGHFAQHVFVEEIVVGTAEGHARDAGINMQFYELEIRGIAAGGFSANLDVAIGQCGAACFHGGFSFGNGSKADGSMRGWMGFGGRAARCAKSLLAEETGGVGSGTRTAEERRIRTDGWWTTLSKR